MSPAPCEPFWASGPATRRGGQNDVREDRETVAAARLERGRARALRGDRRRGASCATSPRRPGPIGSPTPRPFSPREREPRDAACLIFLRTDGAPRLVGGIGFGPTERASASTSSAIGSPGRIGAAAIATEAGRALIAIARDTLRLKRLVAGHFIDNPASGRVLEKLGFRPTGVIAPPLQRRPRRRSRCRVFELDLAGEEGAGSAAMAA